MNPYNQWSGGLPSQQYRPNICQPNPMRSHGFTSQNFQTRFRTPTVLGPSSFSHYGSSGQLFGVQNLAMIQKCRQQMMAQTYQNSLRFHGFQGPNSVVMCNLWNQNTERRHIPVQVNQSRLNSHVAKRSNVGVSSGSSSLIYVNTISKKKILPKKGEENEVVLIKGHQVNSPNLASETGHVKPIFSSAKRNLTNISPSISNGMGGDVDGTKEGGKDEIPMGQFLKPEDGHDEGPEDGHDEGPEDVNIKKKEQNVEEPSLNDVKKTDVDGQRCENLIKKNSGMELAQANVNIKPVIKAENSNEIDSLVEWSSKMELDDKNSAQVSETLDSSLGIVEQKRVSDEEINEANKSAKVDLDEKNNGSKKELPVLVDVVFDFTASTHINLNSDILMNTAILHGELDYDILMIDEDKMKNDGKIVISEESYSEPISKRGSHNITGQESDGSMECIQLIEGKKSSHLCTEKRVLKKNYLTTITGDKETNESDGATVIIVEDEESTSLDFSSVDSKEHQQEVGENSDTSKSEFHSTQDGLKSLSGYGRNDLKVTVQKQSSLKEKAEVKGEGKDNETRGSKENVMSGISQGELGNSVQDEVMSQNIEREDRTVELDVSFASEEVKDDFSVGGETHSDFPMSPSDTFVEVESEVALDSLDKAFENKNFSSIVSAEYTESEVCESNTSNENSCHSRRPKPGKGDNYNCPTSDNVLQEQKCDNVTGIECDAKDSDLAKSCDTSKMEISDLQKLCPGFSLSDKERAAMRERARILARQMSELNQERHSSGGHITTSVSYMQNDEIQGDDALVSDDDDLGTLPSFLASIEKIGEIPSPFTPEKSSGLFDESRSDSPVDNESVLGPKLGFGEQPSVPTKFSLDDLLEEKAKNEDFQRIYHELQTELKAEISKGGFAQMLNGSEEMQDDEILPEYEQQLQQFQMQESQINEQCPGEWICDQQNYGCLFRENILPRHLGYNSTKTFIDQHLANLQSSQVHLLLTSGMLHLCFDAVSNQSLLLRWLFFVLSIHRSYPVMEGCMGQIVRILHLQQNLKKLPITWSPTMADILSVFVNYGVHLEKLVPENQAVAEIREILIHQTEGVEGVEQQEKYSLDNLKMVLQVINVAMQGRPQYSPEDLNMMIKVLFSMALDKSQDMYIAMYELQMCIASLLQLYSDDEWKKQRIKLCRQICGLSAHHHNQMYLAKLLPLGNRGSYLQKRCSFQMLRCLLLKENDQADEILEAFQIKDLFYFLGELKNLATSDFYTLSSAISLLDMAVGNKAIKAAEKDDLINLTDHIKRLTGVVKDNVRALDSTRVKDMMVRVTSKWAIFLQIHGPKQSSIFAWTRPKDSPKMTIEKIQTTCISSDDESDGNGSGEAEQVKSHKTNKNDDIFQMDDSEMENYRKLESHDTSDGDIDDDDDDGDLPEL